MGKVIYDKSMSLDGFIAGANVRLEAGLGDDGERLPDWAFQDPAGMELIQGEGARRAAARACRCSCSRAGCGATPPRAACTTSSEMSRSRWRGRARPRATGTSA